MTLSHNLIIEFHWDFEQIHRSAVSDLIALSDSKALSDHYKNEREKFKALLKTIAGAR